MKFPTLLEAVQNPVGRDRSPISRGLKRAQAEEEVARVEEKGGNQQAGIIRGASVISKGEALGHYAWIDEEALDQVVELGNAAKSGLKVRFTHPSMSGDGLGSFIGRAVNFYREGDAVFADVHLSKTSRETPDGDLGGYVMSLAQNEPDMFGMSIVFEHDWKEEEKFILDHSNDEREFESPDEANAGNHPHIRLSSLYAADFVDDPAANPNGLFHRGPTHDVLTQAESVMEYVLGLSDQVPKETGGLSAERLKGFLNRFLDGRGMELSVSNKEQAMKNKSEKLSEGAEAVDAPETVKAPEASTEKPAESSETQETSEKPEGSEEPSESLSMAKLEQFSAKFGAEKAIAYLKAGTSFEEALSIEFDALQTKSKIVGSESRGEDGPVGTFGAGEGEGRKSRPVDVWARDIIRFRGKAPVQSQN